MSLKFKLISFISYKSYILLTSFLCLLKLSTIEGNRTVPNTKMLFTRYKCASRQDCNKLPGSSCLDGTCTCHQGYLPQKHLPDGKIGCFPSGAYPDHFCDVPMQCHDGLACKNDVCTCLDRLHTLVMPSDSICASHRPMVLGHSCYNNASCLFRDPHYKCHETPCSCINGFIAFETALMYWKFKFALLQNRCYQLYKKNCYSSNQCIKLALKFGHFCICVVRQCHCIPNMNIDIDVFKHDVKTYEGTWKNQERDEGSFVYRHKNYLFLGFVVIMFVLCLFYLMLIMYRSDILDLRGSRARQLRATNQPPDPSYLSEMRRLSLRHSPRRSSRSNSETRNVEVAVNARGVHARLVESQRNVALPRETQRKPSLSIDGMRKGVAPPPTYEEIMRQERHCETPPPRYNDL